MDLYGDLPPASSDGQNVQPLVAAEGWARPQKAPTKMAPRSVTTANLNVAAAVQSPKPKAKEAVEQIPKTNSAIAFMPPSVAAKKLQAAARTTKPKQTAPVKIIHETTPSHNQPTNALEIHASSETAMEVTAEATFDVEDPYDPAHPNDYMQWCAEKKRLKQLEREKRSMQLLLEDQERERQRLAEERQAAIRSGDVATLQAIGRGTGRGVSNLPAWMTKGNEADQSNDDNNTNSPNERTPMTSTDQFANATADDDDNNSSNNNMGSKLMAKMGYKEGEGLGRSSQGINKPIRVQALGGSYGKIVAPSYDQQQQQQEEGEQQQPRHKQQRLFSRPSRVVLLKNMVAPGDVDQSLEEETKEECSRYGPVVRCSVREYRQLPETEAVRTFVEFETQESAVRAYKEMNGRFFGGRQITALFYDEDRFRNGDLEPNNDE